MRRRSPFRRTASTTVTVTIEVDDDDRLTEDLECEISSDVDPPDPSVGLGPQVLGPEDVAVCGFRGQPREPTELEEAVITDWLRENEDRFAELVVEQLQADDEAAYEQAMEDRAEARRERGLW